MSLFVFLTELPTPNIGDFSELQRDSKRLRQQNNNTQSMLGLNYSELNELDSVKVDLVPEKKGVILKHVEYNVTSQVGLHIIASYIRTPTSSYIHIIHKHHTYASYPKTCGISPHVGLSILFLRASYRGLGTSVGLLCKKPMGRSHYNS